MLSNRKPPSQTLRRCFRLALGVAAVTVLGASQIAFAITQHLNKTISLLEINTTGCHFFQLTGVTQADPVAPNRAWFAIRIDQPNSKELYALLLTARTTGVALTRVVTSGQIACGEAEAVTVDL